MGWKLKEVLPKGHKTSQAGFLVTVAGRTVAIDGFMLSHATFAQAPIEHVLLSDWSGSFRTFRSRIARMKSVGSTPIFCFDGKKCPLKSGENTKRLKVRSDAITRARTLHSALSPSSTAEDKLAVKRAAAQAVSIPFEFIYRLVDEVLRPEGVPYFIGPYEADSQLALLISAGIADVLLCADSDLALYLRGFKGEFTWIRKVNWATDELDIFDMSSALADDTDPFCAAVLNNPDVLLDCALACGTDYTSFPGIGPVKGKALALQLFRNHETSDNGALAQVLSDACRTGSDHLLDSKTILATLQDARDLFLYALVYYPATVSVGNLLVPPQGYRDLSAVCGAVFAGPAAEDYVLGIVDSAGLERKYTELSKVYRAGYSTPCSIQPWMLEGACPSLPIQSATVEDIQVWQLSFSAAHAQRSSLVCRMFTGRVCARWAVRASWHLGSDARVGHVSRPTDSQASRSTNAR